MNCKSLYLATDLFLKGGIQRYSRAQINTLIEIFGKDNVSVLSLRSPTENTFEEIFDVERVGQESTNISRIRFVLRVLDQYQRLRPDIVWANHVKILPIASLLKSLNPGLITIGNVYGLEVWSGLKSYEKLALKNSTLVISDCYSTANYVGDNIGVHKERLSVIWDPVDVDRFLPAPSVNRVFSKYRIPNRLDACYLMTLGRVSVNSRHKGYDRIIDVIGSLERDDLIYLIAGDGDDRSRLEKRVISEGLSNNVFFLGAIPEGDLADVYNLADVFILVSDRGPGRGECVPLAPLEAASCAKPIIVGNEDGSVEAVIDGENGFIVSPRDPDSIRKAILDLIDNPKLRTKMGLAGRKRVEKDFSLEAFKSRTEAAIYSLLQ
jgi:phosphatidylinositol alpha-1,6-mannosyltransferase